MNFGRVKRSIDGPLERTARRSPIAWTDEMTSPKETCHSSIDPTSRESEGNGRRAGSFGRYNGGRQICLDVTRAKLQRYPATPSNRHQTTLISHFPCFQNFRIGAMPRRCCNPSPPLRSGAQPSCRHALPRSSNRNCTHFGPVSEGRSPISVLYKVQFCCSVWTAGGGINVDSVLRTLLQRLSSHLNK